jgi:hypothetical protein
VLHATPFFESRPCTNYSWSSPPVSSSAAPLPGRRLWIPENLAYKGQAGYPQGMLVFDVELLSMR